MPQEAKKYSFVGATAYRPNGSLAKIIALIDHHLSSCEMKRKPEMKRFQA